MLMITAKTEMRWAAQVDHVLEVSLLGRVDLAYWTARLSSQNLLPIEHDGKARVLIVTGDARFRGVRFKELSVSVLARRRDDPTEGAFLTQAWNSSRFFAWCERTFFKTPYAYGEVEISAADEASIHLSDHNRTLFHAELRSDNDRAGRQPTSQFPGGWSGPIFLPSPKPTDKPSYYSARLQGLTEIHPFIPETDSLAVNPTPREWSLQSLLDSHFTPIHWEIRRNATHARSKTHTQTHD